MLEVVRLVYSAGNQRYGQLRAVQVDVLQKLLQHEIFVCAGFILDTCKHDTLFIPKKDLVDQEIGNFVSSWTSRYG